MVQLCTGFGVAPGLKLGLFGSGGFGFGGRGGLLDEVGDVVEVVLAECVQHCFTDLVVLAEGGQRGLGLCLFG